MKCLVFLFVSWEMVLSLSFANENSLRTEVLLKKLTMPKNYEEALATHPLRSVLIQKSFLSAGVFSLPASGEKGLRFGQTALSAALLKDQASLDIISKELESSDYIPPLTGTKIKIPGIGCKRNGDYDFLLQYLVALAQLDYISGEKLLTNRAREVLENKFLTETGGKPKSLWFYLPHCGFFKETENHILMTEAARYLTNQWRFKRNAAFVRGHQYNNEKNGLEKWLAHHMADFLKKDFDEFNSKPYESYAMVPFQLLASFADSPRIKSLAAAVLDHLSAKFAVLSISGQRLVPFRRQYLFKHDTDLFLKDPQTSRHAILIGHYPFLFDEFGEAWQSNGRHIDGLWGSLPGYFPPKEIVNAILNKEISNGLHKFSHYNTEIAFKSKSFLLSGGGYFQRWWGWFTEQNHAWARPATLIPGDRSYDLSELIHFKGHVIDSRRANLCVEENFLCGINPYIPENLEVTSELTERNWRFFTLKAGLHVAFWTDISNGVKFGFLEAREANEMTLESFKNIILKNNKRDFGLHNIQTYISSQSRKIQFLFRTQKRAFSNILSVNNKSQEVDTRKWNYVSGDLYNEKVPGVLEFRGQSGELWRVDVRDPMNIKRGRVPDF